MQSVCSLGLLPKEIPPFLSSLCGSRSWDEAIRAEIPNTALCLECATFQIIILSGFSSCSTWFLLLCVRLQRLIHCLLQAVALLLNLVFLFLKCAALETWRCQRKQTQPEPHNRGWPSKENEKKFHMGGKFFSLWHANLRVALQHILNPLNRPTLCFPAPHYFCWISNSRASDGTD